MDDPQAAVARMQALRELAERFERLAQHATIPDVRDSFLRIAELYRQLADAEEQGRQQQNRSLH